jgi:DNA-binding response OmpR family regulator
MKPSILVVDDQIMMTHFLAYYFKKNYEVYTKNDGLEALLWLEEGNIPNAIIADIDMPKLNGFEFIKSIKASNFFNHIPIVMLSSKERSEDRIHCLKLGADDYLTKPFNPEELELKIQRLLIPAQNQPLQ